MARRSSCILGRAPTALCGARPATSARSPSTISASRSTNRGHGASDHPTRPETNTIDRYAADVLALTDHPGNAFLNSDFSVSRILEFLASDAGS